MVAAVSPQVLGFLAVLAGIVLAVAIQMLTGYFTETSRKPVKDVARSSLTGPAHMAVFSGIPPASSWRSTRRCC